MNKAEKFISDCTRNCSNAFVDVNYAKDIKPKGVLEKVYQPWLTPDQARKAVEIAREEMIEKVCSFINDNISEYIDIRGYTGDTFIDVECDRFINDLKQVMKGE